jgi:hypothetical protein
MTEFTTSDGITDVKWKHSAHEDRWYVERKARNHDAIAEFAQNTRRRGGTETKDDARVVATIPEDIFYSANRGLTHGGKYKGFLTADAESQEKLLTQFMLEDDIKIFMMNDNYRV